MELKLGNTKLIDLDNETAEQLLRMFTGADVMLRQSPRAKVVGGKMVDVSPNSYRPTLGIRDYTLDLDLAFRLVYRGTYTR